MFTSILTKVRENGLKEFLEESKKILTMMSLEEMRETLRVKFDSLRKSQSTLGLDNSWIHSTKPKPDLREEKRRVREELERLKWMWIWSMVMEEEELGKRIFNAILWKTMEERLLEERNPNQYRANELLRIT